MTTTVTEYAGFYVHRKQIGQGYVVTDNREFGRGTNVMPGAVYFDSEGAALQAIDVYRVVDGDGAKFWHLLRAIQRQSATV